MNDQPNGRLYFRLITTTRLSATNYLLIDAGESTDQRQIEKAPDCNRTRPKVSAKFQRIARTVCGLHIYIFNKISLVASRRKHSVESPSQYYVAMYRWNHINLRVDINELYLQKYKGFLLDGRRCAWHFLRSKRSGAGALCSSSTTQ